ncbi:MAG: adenylate/guanylate cyclase domain-containing protein [Deltaproteobacteria bacterium]|nr:adenylate/guanylate cyclase domain-containing protein [Deltaproteobacteria bacterium]
MSALDILNANKDLIVEATQARITERLPRYALLNPAELRVQVEAMIESSLLFLEDDDADRLLDQFRVTSTRRVQQGLSISDFLQALFCVIPAVRKVIAAENGGNLHGVEGYTELETRIFDLFTTAAGMFAEVTNQQLRSKNQELNRLSQQQARYEAQLEAENVAVNEALIQANEFNQRVIESLTSGLMVVAAHDGIVNLYTTRMEEILGIPAERVLGKSVEDFSEVVNLDVAALVQRVRSEGRIGLTKLKLNRGDGQTISVFARAQRMYDAAGNPEGTVVVLDDITERELLVESFSRYVSRELVQQVLARSHKLDLGGELQTCSILFADIRGFTTIAESLNPHELHGLLNDYFRVVVEALTHHGGFIDKFIGDNVMAIFSRGSPEHAARSAVDAAAAIVRGLEALNVDREDRGQIPVHAGVGINTGEVMLGNIGNLDRMDFTAIGDAVNVAARLQALAGHGEVLIGSATVELLGEAGDLEKRDEQQVRGRSRPVRFFQLKR